MERAPITEVKGALFRLVLLLRRGETSHRGADASRDESVVEHRMEADPGRPGAGHHTDEQHHRPHGEAERPDYAQDEAGAVVEALADGELLSAGSRAEHEVRDDRAEDCDEDANPEHCVVPFG